MSKLKPVPPNTLYYGDNLDILRRYVDDEPDFWMPRGAWRTRPEGSIKQGSGDGQVPLQPRTWAIMQDAIDEYNRLIADGVAPEQASPPPPHPNGF